MQRDMGRLFSRGSTTRGVAIAAAAVLTALAVVPSFWAFAHIKEAATARKQTFEVIIRANTLLVAMRDAETGERGFALTGDPLFLEPYLAARDTIAEQLRDLGLLALTPTARTHLEAVTPMTVAELSELAHVIELRRNQDLAGVGNAVGSGRGKRLMDAIRVELGEFTRAEYLVLAERQAALESTLGYLFVAMVSGSVVTLFLAVLFSYVAYRQAQQRLSHQSYLETQHRFKLEEEANRALRRVNESLLESEEKLAVTLNSIGDGVIATDAEACVTRLNPVAEQLTGWTQTEAAGRPVDEVFHIVSQATRRPAVLPVVKTLEHGTIQGLANHTVLISRAGAECDIADSCGPIRARDGRVMGAVLVFRNVTAEYTAQRAIRDGAARLQAILNTVGDGIITLLAQSGVVETVNPAAALMFGYSAEELVRRDIGGLIPEFDREKAKGSLEYYLATDEARAKGLGREVMGQRKDGSRFPLEVSVSELLLGGQRSFTAVLRDITTRKEAEAALLKAGALQTAIFNSPNFSSIATDASGIIQIFNVGAERMLGYAAADVMNQRTPADLSDPVELVWRAQALSVEFSTPIAPGFDALVYKAARGIADVYELTLVRMDGTRFPAVVSVTALRDDLGAIIGYLLIGTDNSAGKQIELEKARFDQRLRDEQFYTRSLIEAHLDALVITDPRGIITDANKQMEALTACTRDELIGAPFKNYFTDPERAAEAIQQALRDKRVTDFELCVRDRGGQTTLLSYNASTFYDRDRVLQGVFAAGRDVTERQQSQKALLTTNVALELARSVAEKASLAKSDFLSSMSHELRSPLNAILGFAQLMESGMPTPTDPQKESIAQILQAGWHLLSLINEILDLAVIEAGKLSLSTEPVSLGEVLSECQAMLDPEAQQRGLQMTFPRFDTPHFVSADRTRLKQVVINLLSNAVKYNRAQGKVVVEWRASTPLRTRVSVRDTGAGLSPEKLAQLFEAFNRLGQEDVGGVAGTGIGLVVTKRLVELMGGMIGVESTPGTGSLFWFELISTSAPHIERAASDSVTPKSTPVPTDAPKHTLLYVEDNQANMRLVEQIIARRPDIRLLTAGNGLLGIDLARSTLPTVILMDINLPGISGVGALRALRDDPTTAHIPVIALSANANPRDIENGLKLGFLRYLTKPIKIHEFLETLDAALLSQAASPR